MFWAANRPTTRPSRILNALNNDEGLQSILGQIQVIKNTYAADSADNGDPSAAVFAAEDLAQQTRALIENEIIQKVFIEKEILGSLLADKDEADFEIALTYAYATKVVRGEETGISELDHIDDITLWLEYIDKLSEAAARKDEQVLRFMAMLGFDCDNTADNASPWNTMLWNSLASALPAGQTQQYALEKDIREPLKKP